MQKIVTTLLTYPLLLFLTLQVFLIHILEKQQGVMVLFFVLFLGVSAYYLFKKKRLLIFGGMLILLGMMFCWDRHSQLPLSKNHIRLQSVYIGKIVSNEILQNNKTYYDVELIERQNPLPEKVSGKIKLIIDGTHFFSKNSILRFTARISALKGYYNPGGFDYITFMQRQNIWAKMFVEHADDIEVVQAATPSVFDSFRQKISQKILTADLKNKAIILALLFGNAKLDTDFLNQTSLGGITHLFVISGLHFGMMASLVYKMISVITQLFPSVYVILPKQKIICLCTFIFVVSYTLLINSSPSVVRASILISCLLLNVLLEKNGNSLFFVALAASLHLLWQPKDLFQLSFQLSYLCFLILIVIGLPTYEKTKNFLQTLFFTTPQNTKTKKSFKIFSLLGKKTLSLLISTTIMHFCLAPFLLIHFHFFSLAGLVNNMWAIPFFGLLIMPFLFATGVVFLFSWHVPAFFLLHLTDHLIDFFVHFFLFLNTHLSTTLAVPIVDSTVVTLFYLGLFGFCGVFNRVEKKIVLLLFCFFIGQNIYDRCGSFDVKVTQIDVGQGDSILIQTPEKTVLVDTGGHLYFDMAQRVLLPLFKNFWINEIDLLIISHADFDHYGSASQLLDLIPVHEIWINNKKSPSKTYTDFLKKAEDLKIKTREIIAAEELKIDKHTRLDVLSPHATMQKLTNDNDRSLVLKLIHKNQAFLLTGDIGPQAEKLIIRQSSEKLPSTFLKVSHHGSKSSTQDSFVRSVSPRFALIGVGRQSQFGHPSKDVIERLHQHGVQILRTDKHGAIQVRIKNDKINIRCERECQIKNE